MYMMGAGVFQSELEQLFLPTRRASTLETPTGYDRRICQSEPML